MINKDLNLEVWPTDEEVGEYLSRTLGGGNWPDVTLTQVPEIVALLQSGNDPFLIAVEQKRDFGSVVRLAENQLVNTFGPLGKDPDGNQIKYLPGNMRDYLFMASALETKNQDEAREEVGFFGRALLGLQKFSKAVAGGLAQ